MKRSLILGLALLCAAVAPAQTVRDSAGIQIVTNEKPILPAAQALRLGAKPTLVIGNKEGEKYELSRVAGAVRLSDGKIVVADGGSFELRFFDETGVFMRTAGQRGDGPGEFRRIESLARLPGDTIAVVGQLAVSHFTDSGKFVRALSVITPPMPMTLPISVMAMFPRGSRLVTNFFQVAPRTRGAQWVDSTALLIVDSLNAVTHRLGKVPFLEIVMEDYPRPPWFSAIGAFASDTGRFYYGFGREYSIRSYTSEARFTRIIRRSWTPVKVTRGDINDYQSEWGKRWIRSTGAQAERERADLRDDPYASIAPAFAQFILDAAGRLWVREAHVADAAWAGQLNGVPLVPSKWSVFDTGGRWLCDVSMPARFLPKEIGRDYVLGVARGVEDVETVVLYPISGGGRIP